VVVFSSCSLALKLSSARCKCGSILCFRFSDSCKVTRYCCKRAVKQVSYFLLTLFLLMLWLVPVLFSQVISYTFCSLRWSRAGFVHRRPTINPTSMSHKMCYGCQASPARVLLQSPFVLIIVSSSPVTPYYCFWRFSAWGTNSCEYSWQRVQWVLHVCVHGVPPQTISAHSTFCYSMHSILSHFSKDQYLLNTLSWRTLFVYTQQTKETETWLDFLN